MGVVYMAEQDQPVRRRVALKIIKPGMDTDQVVARFEAERQALALMDHPNIARVFDAGATDSGRPFFVMELVKGVPITEYCDAGPAQPSKERLELFVPVCQAIQHAHQKGIIHRDVKPTNVLVTIFDDKPVPKVIDFGVAKATAQRLTERTLFTGFGADRRDAGVHEPRAGGDDGTGRGHPQRRLLAGGPALRAADRHDPPGTGEVAIGGPRRDPAADQGRGYTVAQHATEPNRRRCWPRSPRTVTPSPPG